MAKIEQQNLNGKNERKIDWVKITTIIDGIFFHSSIEGSCSVDRINCSLVTPVSRQTQSDGY